MIPSTSPEDFLREEMTFLGKSKSVYRHGDGPGLVVMPELPGPHPALLEFVRFLGSQGFCVYVPELIGKLGQAATPGYFYKSWIKMCISSEFHVLAHNGSSPVVDWLRCLCNEIRGRHHSAVGVIGMCLTGNFALALILEPSVAAAVGSQPSLPLPVSISRRGALHLPKDFYERFPRSKGCAMALRFTKDPFVPDERMDRLRTVFQDRLEVHEIESDSVGPSEAPWGPHSVLAGDFVNEDGHPTMEARMKVLSFLKEHVTD